MSDTPETDNAVFNGYEDGAGMPDIVTADFARKLERERDEAREQLRIARDKCHQQRMFRLAGDKVYAEMCHEAEEQARILAMSADREEKLRSKILMRAKVYRGEDLRDNSRWSIFNEGRAQALEKLADETWP